MVKTHATVLSLNPGIGVHLEAYESLGAQISLALEWRDKERTTFTANTNYPCEALDVRWFYNRKEKGTDKLLELMKLKKVGDLDVLNATTDLLAFTGKNRQRSSIYAQSDQNLFDVFGIARRLRPKIVIVYGPASLLQSPDTQRLHTMLDFLRYDSLKREDRKKIYAVHSTLVDASAFGVGVSKQYTLIVGVRSDIAKKIGITTDLGVNFLIPRKGKIRGFGECIKNIKASDAESEFWSIQTRSDAKLFKSIGFLKKEPEEPIVFQPNAREKVELGFPQKRASTVARASNDHPIPDPTIYDVIHPRFGRKITLSELRASFGIPSNWKFKASDLDAYSMVANSVPSGLAKAVFKNVALKTLSGSLKIKEESDPHLERVRQAETLLVHEGEGRTYHCPVDLGASYGKKVEGQLPGYKDFVYLFDANEINEDFTVLGAFDPTIGRRPVIGAVKRKVFEKEDRRRFVKAIKGVKGTTAKRLTCSTKPITQERIERYTEQGRRFEVSEDGFRIRLWVEETSKEPAHWDTWQSEPIPSATVGWLRDRNSKVPQYAGNKDEAFIELNKKAEAAYYKLAPADFVKQRTFLNMRVPRDFRLGGSAFTTLAVNQYGNEMPAMGYHQDTGDNNSGLTTISVFDEGTYTGGYFVIPRYQCAFRVGDGDVFVANSREYHGVASLNGNGKRMSVVSYTKTDLAYKQDDASSYPAKSPRPNFRWNQYRFGIALPKDFNTKEPIRTVEFLKAQGVAENRIVTFNQGDNPLELFEENTPVVFMTPDVDGYLVRANKQNLIGKDFLLEVVRRGFDACRENNAYLFSWNNSWSVTNSDERDSDGAFEDLEEKLQIGEFHPAPTCIGVVIRKNLKASYDGSEASTLAMGSEHFQKDGRIIRLGHVSDLDAYENVSQLEGETTLPSKVEPIERLARLPAEVPKLRKPQILAMGGVPATGKSTIMRRLMSEVGGWKKIRIGNTLDAHHDEANDFYILGDYSDGAEVFAGTDRLSMAVQTDVPDFLKSLTPKTKVVYEGDRLFKASFLEACNEAKVGFEILEITASKNILKQRHQKRGDNQSVTFLRAKETSVRNLVRAKEYWRQVKSLPHETEQDSEFILEHLAAFFGKRREKKKVTEEKVTPPSRPDYRLNKNRMLGFDKYYRYHCATGDWAPDIVVERWISDELEFDYEKRCALAFFHGAVIAGPAEMLFAHHFPILTGKIAPVVKFFEKNKNNLTFSKDARYRRMVFTEFLESVGKSIKPFGTLGNYIQSCFDSDDKHQNYLNLQERCMSDWYHWGRMGHWGFSEALAHYLDAPIEPPSMEFAQGKSHRSGWAFCLGRDDLVGDRISKSDCEYLEQTAAEYIQQCDFPNATFFTLETACCNYKRQHKGTRYGGCYIDEQHNRIVEAKAKWGKFDFLWDKYLEGRAALMPKSSLFEHSNSDAPSAYLNDWNKALKDFGRMPRVEAWYDEEPQQWVSLKQMPFYK